jgi:hypothetical protein
MVLGRLSGWNIFTRQVVQYGSAVRLGIFVLCLLPFSPRRHKEKTTAKVKKGVFVNLAVIFFFVP